MSRTIPAPASTAGPLLDRLAEPGAGIWPSETWPPLTLDRGLAAGSAGGHGPIRYEVTDHEPGRRVRFAFHPRVGLVGHHEFTVEETATGTAVTHVIIARSRGRMLLGWPLAVRWLHEALLADLLDNWERAATGSVRSPSRWSRWVRLLRWGTAQL